MSYAPVSTLDDGGMQQNHHPSTASSYSMSHTSNEFTQQQLTASLNLNQAQSTIYSSSFTHIPEAAQLQWMDDFYQGKPGIVAVFDRDGFLAGNFQFWHFVRITGVLIVLAIVYYSMGIWIANTQNDEDLVILDDVQSFYFLLIAGLFVAMAYRADLQQRQQHVAITTEGIRIDQGMAMTIIIPFETIHSCQAFLSTKYLCGKMERSDLTQVQVVRSLAPMEQIGFRKTRSFVIYGLARPQEFVALVQAFKNSQQHGTYAGGTELTSSSMAYRGPEASVPPPVMMGGQVPPPQQLQQQQFVSPQQAIPMMQQPQVQSTMNPSSYGQQSQLVSNDHGDVVTAI